MLTKTNCTPKEKDRLLRGPFLKDPWTSLKAFLKIFSIKFETIQIDRVSNLEKISGCFFLHFLSSHEKMEQVSFFLYGFSYLRSEKCDKIDIKYIRSFNVFHSIFMQIQGSRRLQSVTRRPLLHVCKKRFPMVLFPILREESLGITSSALILVLI